MMYMEAFLIVWSVIVYFCYAVFGFQTYHNCKQFYWNRGNVAFQIRDSIYRKMLLRYNEMSAYYYESDCNWIKWVFNNRSWKQYQTSNFIYLRLLLLYYTRVINDLHSKSNINNCLSWLMVSSPKQH